MASECHELPNGERHHFPPNATVCVCEAKSTARPLHACWSAVDYLDIEGVRTAALLWTCPVAHSDGAVERPEG